VVPQWPEGDRYGGKPSGAPPLRTLVGVQGPQLESQGKPHQKGITYEDGGLRGIPGASEGQDGPGREQQLGCGLQHLWVDELMISLL